MRDAAVARLRGRGQAVKPPLNRMEAITQIATTQHEYGLSEMMGAHYAAEFNVAAFAANGITYRNSGRELRGRSWRLPKQLGRHGPVAQLERLSAKPLLESICPESFQWVIQNTSRRTKRKGLARGKCRSRTC